MTFEKTKGSPVPPGGLLESEELSQLVAALNSDGDGGVGGGEVPSQRQPVVEPVDDRVAVQPVQHSLPQVGADFHLGAGAGGRFVSPDTQLGRLLTIMKQRGASDLHLVVGQRRHLRVGGALRQLDDEVLGTGSIASLFSGLLTERDLRILGRESSVDLALFLEGQGSRFRVNLHRQQSGDAAAIRLLPETVPSWNALGLPRSVLETVDAETGLVFVCGPTGSGKSTTLAAQLDHLNRERDLHILTIEEPVEYVHRPKRSLVQQIEVGTDTPSFASALRAALRQDPDVILLGEMRDAESLQTALSAAETGHLILSTLHTADAAQSIHRIVDLVSESAQHQVRQQLALSLHSVICQRLVPRCDGGGVVPAVEILRATYPVRQHIRQGAVQKIYNEIATGRRHGMVSLESSLVDLARRGLISTEEARLRARRPEEFDSLLRG